MTDADATDCVALLVVAGNGYTDEVVDALCDLMATRWNNPDAARTAVTQVADTWQGMGRPPWGTLHQAYQSAVRRQIMEQPALPASSASYVTPAQGRQIAARAYARECERRGPQDIHILSGHRTNDPNPEYLDRMLGLTKADDQ